jgi:hypothetical protein
MPDEKDQRELKAQRHSAVREVEHWEQVKETWHRPKVSFVPMRYTAKTGSTPDDTAPGTT